MMSEAPLQMRDQSNQQKQNLMVNIRHGKAMADTGCHSPIAGPNWHSKYQERSDLRGWPYYSTEQCTDFTFGPSEAVVSTKCWHYKCKVFGVMYDISISELPIECPTLISKKELKTFGFLWGFEGELMMAATGWKHCTYTDSGHPIIDLLDDVPPNRLDTDMIYEIARVTAAENAHADQIQDDELKRQVHERSKRE